MSTLEDRLRDAFRADAETVRPEAIPGPPVPSLRSAPRRPRSRRRVLIPLAAAAAVIAIVIGVSVTTSLFGGRTHSVPGLLPPLPTSGSRPAAPVPGATLGAQASAGVPASALGSGVPRFYVTVYDATGPVNYIVVRHSATGKVAGRMNPPAGYFFAGIAAPAGNRAFVTAVESNAGCTSQLYWFRLNDQGQPGPLMPLHITVPGTYSETGDLAITPDGRTIGYATYLCDGEGEVGIIHLATRQVRVWSWTGFSAPMNLSLSADGRLLGYARFAAGTRQPGGAFLLAASAPAGSLAKRSRVVSRTALWTALAGDGTSLYYCAVAPYHRGTLPNVGTLTYGTLSLPGGSQQVIASWPSLPGPQCYASLDPAGRYLLVQFPATVPQASDWSRPAILDLQTGRLTDIHAPAFYGPFDIAW